MNLKIVTGENGVMLQKLKLIHKLIFGLIIPVSIFFAFPACQGAPSGNSSEKEVNPGRPVQPMPENYILPEPLDTKYQHRPASLHLAVRWSMKGKRPFYFVESHRFKKLINWLNAVTKICRPNSLEMDEDPTELLLSVDPEIDVQYAQLIVDNLKRRGMENIQWIGASGTKRD